MALYSYFEVLVKVSVFNHLSENVDAFAAAAASSEGASAFALDLCVVGNPAEYALPLDFTLRAHALLAGTPISLFQVSQPGISRCIALHCTITRNNHSASSLNK